MQTDTRLKAVMICGAGHSGSTLLGMVLGGADGAFYVGEGGKIRYLHDEKKALRKRVCKLCGEPCEVWSRFHWNHDEALYPQVARHTGSSLIIDSTKNDEWIEARDAELRAAGGLPHLILLTRDGRAVINSRIRKYPGRDAEEQIRDWVDQMRRSMAVYDAFDGPKRRIQYEELASRPEEVTRSLCTFLGLSFDPKMLNFNAKVFHPLGGNSGTQFVAARAQMADPNDAFVTLGSRTRDYYEQHPEAIRLDLRWRSELSAEHARLFEQLAGDFNLSMKWGD